ncbi:flagellar motor switch protein FliN [Magnetofaba australis]|uniref:Flagellar motor switch protein FliN n=1 Tax=Magnetofaba australis IT-1 TaxID=1434232 RepID=A0A1Y2K220_9PROT|nr:flagellar motor switch protein FliN [Magnetofaba australis]OSM00371.1 putative flagellar motor switch protein FliN [Magnetofaba australis IT-1]
MEENMDIDDELEALEAEDDGLSDFAQGFAGDIEEDVVSLASADDDDDIKNLDLLMDVPLEVSVRLGHVRMQIGDLLRLNKGSLVELEKEADDPLEVYVNDRLLAYGEVVMIKDKLGIRITDIVSLKERLENLR